MTTGPADFVIFYIQSIALDEAVSAHPVRWENARRIDFSYSKTINNSLGRVHCRLLDS